MPTKPTKEASKSDLDALSLLKQDHKKVKQLLSQLKDSKTAKRVKLLGRIEFELAVHMKIEEELFYPAFKEAMGSHDDKQLFFEAREEHHVARGVIAEIKSTDPDSEEFEAKGKVLKDLIKHHVKEEEEQMFHKARKAMGMAELRRLGQTMQNRRAAMISSVTTPKKKAA